MSAAGPLVYITGASSGIGQALAARFYRAGYRVALVARRANDVAAWAQHQGLETARYAVYAADVRNVSDIVAAGRACMASQGLPDVVVANAGISIGMDTEVFDDLEVMRATYETNNIGLAATFHPFVAAMRARGAGVLVGVGSVGGVRGMPGHGAYCSSKAAVAVYCESLRGELRGSGVKVLTLVPGYVATPLTSRNRYVMPFLMQPDAFAQKAFQAIEHRAAYRVIPWQMGVVAKLLRLLPNALFDRLLAGRPRKRRADE